MKSGIRESGNLGLVELVSWGTGEAQNPYCELMDPNAIRTTGSTCHNCGSVRYYVPYCAVCVAEYMEITFGRGRY
jgi:uncharacterized OB-fold protein